MAEKQRHLQHIYRSCICLDQLQEGLLCLCGNPEETGGLIHPLLNSLPKDGSIATHDRPLPGEMHAFSLLMLLDDDLFSNTTTSSLLFYFHQ